MRPYIYYLFYALRFEKLKYIFIRVLLYSMYFIFLKDLFFYVRERERVSQSVRRKGQGERIYSRLCAEHGAQWWGWSPQPMRSGHEPKPRVQCSPNWATRVPPFISFLNVSSGCLFPAKNAALGFVLFGLEEREKKDESALKAAKIFTQYLFASNSRTLVSSRWMTAKWPKAEYCIHGFRLKPKE